ncbi:MAG: hypothetical protein OXI75_01985 [Rhodospirillales bacterium]|nr:hypothetical protein [Rhodospirillales bacterium]
MLETLFNLGVSVLTGGATGLLGTALSAVVDFFQSRQRHAQELDLRRLDIELAKAEAEGAAAHAAIEAQATREKAEWEAMEASYREAARRWSRPGEGWAMQLVDVVRGLTRPALTWSLFALVGAIYFLLGASDLAAVSLRPRIVETVLYLFTAAILWWFGARQIEKRRSREGGAAG